MSAERCWKCGLVRDDSVAQLCPLGSSEACRADTNQYANIWTALGICWVVLVIAAAAALGGLV